MYPLGKANPDVDVLPRAEIAVIPRSGAADYGRYSAFLSKIDGRDFDGFWCNIIDVTCDRGPFLARTESNQLLEEASAELAIHPSFRGA